MEYILIILIIYLIILDAHTLQDEDELLYSKILKRSPKEYAVVSLLILIISGPIYYFRRRKMLVLLKEQRQERGYINPKFNIIIESCGLFFQWVFLSFILDLTFIVLGEFFNQSLLLADLSSQLTNIIFIYLIYKTIKNNRKESFSEVIRFNKNISPRFFIYPILIAFFFIAVNSINRSYQITDIETPLGKSLRESNDFSILFFAFTGIFLAPLFEEIIFRGYFFSAIKEVKGTNYAVIVISLMFGLFHVEQLWGNWIAIIVIFSLGFCFSLLRAKSDSIIPGLIAHYTYNTFLLILPIFGSSFS